MKIEIITSTDEFMTLKEEWEYLEKQENETTIFQTFLYNYIWWESVEKLNKYELCIIVVREESNKLLGIAPFIIENQKKFFFQIRTLKFMAWGDYLNILINTANKNYKKIISEIFRSIEKLRIDRVILTNINIKSILGNYLKKHQTYNYNFSFQVECPRVYFSNYNSFEIFKSKYLTSNLRNKKNKMQKEINYKFIIKMEENENNYKQIERIHKELKNKLNEYNNNEIRKSSFENFESQNFLEKYYKNSDNIVNFFLMKDNEIIMYDSCYFFKNILYSWIIAHVYEYNKYSPGGVMNYEIMKWGFEQNNDKLIFDFGCGGYPWKFQWTEDFTAVYKLEYIISNSIKIKIYERLKYIKRGLECFLKVFKI